MISFTVYETATGAIRSSGRCHEDDLQLQDFITGTSVIEGASGPDTHYVLDGVITEKIAMPAFDKTAIYVDLSDAATVTGLPNPTTATITGNEYALVDGELTQSLKATEHLITDGTLRLVADTWGEYRVRLDAGIAYRVVEVTITCNPL